MPTPNAIDLTTLDAVTSWLALNGASLASATVTLGPLITATSADFLRAVDRVDFFPAVSYTEVREGDGATRISLRHWPIAAVTAVTVAGAPVAASADRIAAGWYIDADLDPEQRTQLYVVGSTFTDLAQVVVSYQAGYVVPPSDVVQAVTEWVADRYTGRGGMGKASQRGAGGENVVYEKEESAPLNVQEVIDRYRRERPSVDRRTDEREYKISKITIGRRTTQTTRVRE